jgi:hypothetical protein
MRAWYESIVAIPYACIIVWLGRCCWVWDSQTGMLHWETGELMTSVTIVIKVLAKESRKEGLRNCVLHLGELVTDILDDSMDKLPFLL